ncbi:MAG: hypothetical protein NC121_18930, partial [Blautia sp.]|nr:hypothetical protein [Blautia sp.]
NRHNAKRFYLAGVYAGQKGWLQKNILKNVRKPAWMLTGRSGKQSKSGKLIKLNEKENLHEYFRNQQSEEKLS